MSDAIAAAAGEETITAGAASDTGAAPGDAQNGAEGAGATKSETGADPSTATPEPPVVADWPDDWRDRFAKKAPATEREKLAKRLARFGSPDNVLSSFLELERKQSAGLLKKGLSENPSPEEIAEYRQANGIPEEATLDTYGIKLPEGVEVDETTKADLAGFLGKMHAKNVPPAVVQEVMGEYFAAHQAAQQQLYEAAQQQTIEYKSQIKAEYGRDYERNMRLGNARLVETLGEENAKGITGLTLADGTKLGDHPDFVRYIVGTALATADDAALITGEFGGAGKSIDDQYAEALKLMNTDPKTYWSEAHQAKLNKLATARSRR